MNRPMVPDPDRRDVVDDGPEVELREKASRFIARAFRAENAGAAEACLARVRRTSFDATHHCWAARLGDGEPPVERSDDDGEPSGTAGLPILGAIRHAGLGDTLVVVTRYFGGTRLGTGGLVRAYGEAARLALEAAPRRVVWRESTLETRFDYADLGTVETAVGKAGDAVLSAERSFDPAPRLLLTVKRSRAEPLRAALVEATSGRAAVAIRPR